MVRRQELRRSRPLTGGVDVEGDGRDSGRAVARAWSVVSMMAAPPLVPVVVAQVLSRDGPHPASGAAWVLPLAGGGLLVALVGPVAVIEIARRTATREADGDVVGLGVLAGLFCAVYAVMEAVDGITRPEADRISAWILAVTAVAVTTASLLWFRRRHARHVGAVDDRPLTPPAPRPPPVPDSRSTRDATWWWGATLGLVVTVVLLAGVVHDAVSLGRGTTGWWPTALEAALTALWVVILVGFLRSPRPSRAWPDPLAGLHPTTARRVRAAARGHEPVPPDLLPTVLAHLERRRHHAVRASWVNAGVALGVLVDGARSVTEPHGHGAGHVVVLVVGALGLLAAALDVGSRYRAARRLAVLTSPR